MVAARGQRFPTTPPATGATRRPLAAASAAVAVRRLLVRSGGWAPDQPRPCYRPVPPPTSPPSSPPLVVLAPPTSAAVRAAVRAGAGLRGYIERLQGGRGGRGGHSHAWRRPPRKRQRRKQQGRVTRPRMYIKERGAPLQGIAVGHRMPRRSRCCAVHKAQLHHSTRRKNARVLHHEHLLHSHPTSRNLTGQRSPSCQAPPFSFLPLDAAAHRRHSIGKGARVQ